MSPIISELERRNIDFFVIHSSQHYSPELDSKIFFDLELATPKFRLKSMKHLKTHGAQTGAMISQIEQVLINEKPTDMLVFGDTNSNLAAGLAARKLHINVAHIEAGERSYDWKQPEEHNRKILDVISDMLFVSGEKAKDNLLREGIPDYRIHLTGNPIVDASHRNLEKAEKKSKIIEKMKLSGVKYGIMTMHREGNTEDASSISNALNGVSQAAKSIGLDKVLFFAHPRTQDRITQFGLDDTFEKLDNISIHSPLSYLDFLCCLKNSEIAFSDSGGVAQESLINRIPCVVLRETTEWVEAIELGAQKLAGCDPNRIENAAKQLYGTDTENWGWPFGMPDSSKNIIDALLTKKLSQL